MRHLLKLALAPIVVAGPLFGSAAAAPITTNHVAAVRTADNLIEPVQFVWRGHQYCRYFDGWHGPGWYLCGYASRPGHGWGGPAGWHGWQDNNTNYDPERRGVTRPGGGSDHK